MVVDTAEKKMGIKRMMRATALGALVVMHGMSDDILFGITPKKSNEFKEVKKTKSKETVFREQIIKTKNEKNKTHKRKKPAKMGKLVTDAIPSKRNGKKNNSPTKIPSLEELYNDEDDFKKDVCVLKGIPKVQIEDCSSDDECDGNQYMVDEVDDDEEEEEEDEECYKKKKSRHSRHKSDESSRRSAERDKNFSYQATSNTYHITNSKDIHIGPYYEQKLIINGIDQGVGRKSAIKETREIKAIKANGAPLTKEQILIVSGNIGHAWLDVGRRLGYNDAKLQQFDLDYRTQKEKVYQLLMDWVQDEDDKATCAKLCKTLWEADAKEAVEVLAIHAVTTQKRSKSKNDA